MKQWIDLPPVWLLGALVIAWLQSSHFAYGLDFGGAWADLLGGLLVGGGVLLALLAFYEFNRHKTTLIPHREASHMVKTGIYSRTRNPIYVGDVLILMGLILYWDAVLSLPLIPIFVWIIERRFIIPEENRLRRKFRAEFAKYEKDVRRWV